MASAVIHIDHTITPEELDGLLRSAGDDGLGARFVHVTHGPNEIKNCNLIRMSRVNPIARRCLVELASRGYYPYLADEEATRLVRSDRIGSLWAKIVQNEYRISADDVVYCVEPPLEEKPPTRLLVILSAVYEFPNRVGLQRYFGQDYPTVRKYMPHGTAVLRIADLGGVIGAFYLNTTHRPRNAEAIRNLIEAVRTELGIEHDAVVLFGVSKGGCGALYHGLTAGYRFVAVDPLLTDEHYEAHYNDSHFTKGGIFPASKDEVFERLLGELASQGTPASFSGRGAVICSERSPLFASISRMLITRFEGSMSFFNSKDPMIHDHGDVGRRTINCSTMLLSMQLYGLSVPTGLHSIE